MIPSRLLKGASVLVGVLLVGALAGAWTARIDASEHVRYARSLRSLVELDAQINEQIAESRMGLVTHYDSLVRTGDVIAQTWEAVEEIPQHVPPTERDALQEALSDVQALLKFKSSLIERFKTDLAVLRNAQRALSHSIERIRSVGSPESLAQVSPRLTAVMLHLNAPSVQRADAAACALSQLSPAGDTEPGCPPLILPESPALVELLEAVRWQGEAVLERQPVVDDQVHRLMTFPVAEQVADIEVIYSRAYQGAAARSGRRLRVLEGLIALAFLLGAALIVSRLQADAAALRSTTERLHVVMISLEKERDREAELARLKSRFVSMASHEFRTPLSVILSSAEMLEAYNARWSEARRNKHLHRIQESCRSMSRMIDRVLVIGKADAELLEVSPSPVALTALVDDVITEVKTTVEPERRLEVVSTAAPGLRTLDEKLLRHILINLLTNAFKYSPDHSTVYLSIEEDDDSASFEIRDEGIGIPPDELDHLFEPFHRCTNAASIPGTGLGLAIVKRSVDAHRGVLEVDSTPGQGSRFRVRIPFLKEHA